MKISPGEIIEYRDKYERKFRGTQDDVIEKELKGWFLRHKYLDRSRFIKLGLWKSKRARKHYEDKENDNLTVREITKLALTAKSEKARIKSLMALRGVSWPVASVILHFAFPDKYPILDFRAIWVLGWQQPKSYNFSFWQKYIRELRKKAKEHKVSLRDLDKALWYYSYKHQKGRKND